MALTEKQWLYAKARASGLSQTRAAIQAGYSEKTAQPASSRLEKEPAIIAAIEKIKSGDVTQPPLTPAGPALAPCLTPEQAAELVIGPVDDPLVFLDRVMNHERVDLKIRVDCAKSLASYTHVKPGEKGKKEQAEEAAKKAASGTDWASLLSPGVAERKGAH